MNDDSEKRERSRNAGATVRLVLAALLLVALVLFVAQNTDDVAVDWLVFDLTLPLWLLLVLTAVVGAVLGEVAGWLFRRRGRD